MRTFQQTLLVLASACAFALAGCKGDTGPAGANGSAGTSCTVTDNGDGTKTITCTDGTSATVSNGAPGTNGTSCTVVDNPDSTRTITCTDGTSVTVSDAVVDYTLLSDAERLDALPGVVITSVTVPTDGRPLVSFKVSDRKGNGIQKLVPGSVAGTVTFRFALLKLAAGVNGSANSTWVGYMGASATSTSSSETAAAANLTDNGDGTYVYRFAKVVTDPAQASTTWEPTLPHRLVMLFYASGNPFQPVNVVTDFVPATTPFQEDVSRQYEKVDPAACLECHTRFRALAGGTGAFHSGTRYDVRGCVACHNDQRRFTTLSATTVDDSAIQPDGTWTGNLAIVNGEGYINLPVFIHKIHMGEDLTLRGGTYPGFSMPYEVTFPQDVRNCAKCHRNAALADNWKNQPSRRACGACHDNVSFAATVPNFRVQHTGAACTSDTDCSGMSCTTCHGVAGANGPPARHLTVVPPDPNNVYLGGTNANTNAAWMAAAGAVPAGANVISYDVSSVSTWTDTSVTPNVNRPQVVFKLKKDGADVNFGTYDAITNPEIISGFVGSPSAYFAFALPQDGVTAPADFNATASGYIKNIWKGTATGTGAGTISGPDASGYYTIQLTGVVVPATATMLTGGVGYTYSLGSATATPPFSNNSQPLTQIDLAAYPYTPNASGYGGTGGLIVPAPNVWKVATGFTGRRTIVDTAKCQACHNPLGVAPSFHAGQRNNAPTCSFCHNPNRTSSAWSANAKDFVHAIHGAGKRVVPFTWHEVSATEGYWQVTYPGILNSCQMCHVAGMYDFSATASASAVPNMLSSTVGQGTYAVGSVHSPYVTEGVAYGSGFSFTSSTGAYVDAAATTLVKTPITAACSACHDAPLAIAHMESNGGSFYQPRSSALPAMEQCLLCHGPGKIAAIADMHK